MRASLQAWDGCTTRLASWYDLYDLYDLYALNTQAAVVFLRCTMAALWKESGRERGGGMAVEGRAIMVASMVEGRPPVFTVLLFHPVFQGFRLWSEAPGWRGED